MISVSSLYQDAVDAVLKESNGELSMALFNRYSKLAELKLIDWITGDITGRQPPEPYTTQKDKDWVAPFIVSYESHVTGGKITRPGDYYGFENLYTIAAKPHQEDCNNEQAANDNIPAERVITPITLLDGGQFSTRCKTYIEEKKPSHAKPIAKEVGKNFEFAPQDLGSVGLEYYRYPDFALIVTKVDPVYNNLIVDEALSKNYEWDEKARPLLIWFIVDMFANRTSNQAQKIFNTQTGKTPHTAQQPQ